MGEKEPGILRGKWYVWLAIGFVLAIGILRLVGNSQAGSKSVKLLGIGKNNYSQLGGTNKNSHKYALEPLQLTNDVTDQKINSSKAGLHFTVILTVNGQVYTMGDNSTHAVSEKSQPLFAEPQKVNFPDLKPGEKIVQVDASRDHTAALTSDGRVYTWGSNYTGQLGDGTNTDRGTPKVVEGLPKVKAVTAGYRHSAVITDDGEVYAWGGVCKPEAMAKSQELLKQAAANIASLGGYLSKTESTLRSEDATDCTTVLSSFVQSTTPKKLAGLEGKPTQISAGYGHLLVLNDQGKVFSAGCNTYQQLGREKATGANKNDLSVVDLPKPATQISAGYRHSAVILNDSTAWLWGYSFNNGLNVGYPLNDLIPRPQLLDYDHKVIFIEAGHDTSFAISDSRQVIGWGKNDNKAFWPKEKVFGFTNLGQVKAAQTALLSAGMEHLLLTEDE